MKLHIVKAAAVAVLVAFAPAPVRAQQQPPPEQVNQQILNELRAIRQLLEKLTVPPQPAPAAAPAPPQNLKLTGLTGYVLGRPDAPLTMVEFTDLQCPFCRQFHVDAFGQIKKDYIDTGKLRYITRDFPLDFHAHAMLAARAARCSGEQGKFWEMRESLVRNADKLRPDLITATAGELKLDAKAFAGCVTSSRFDAEIRKDMADAAAAGVSGTPTFVVGRSTADGVDGVVLVGAQPYAVFDARLQELLKPAPGTKQP